MDIEYDLQLNNIEKQINKFIDFLNNNDITKSKKMTFFIESQTQLKEIMNFLKSINDENEDFVDFCSSENIHTEDFINKSIELINKLQKAITDYQNTLYIDENVESEDIAINEETISDALQNNSTTKQIHEDLENIKKSSMQKYNYCIMLDNNISMFHADNDNEINKYINTLLLDGNYKEVKLFKLSEVKLSKQTITKTIYTV